MVNDLVKVYPKPMKSEGGTDEVNQSPNVDRPLTESAIQKKKKQERVDKSKDEIMAVKGISFGVK